MIERLKTDAAFRQTVSAWGVLIFDICYTGINLYLGWAEESFWFVTTGVYYLILTAMRFVCIRIDPTKERRGWFLLRFTGIMFILLCVTLIGTVILSVRLDVAKVYHEVVMIAMAAFTFTKLTLAIINAIQAARKNLPLLFALRNISFADALVSILTLQRSMLVSFGEMDAATVNLFNILSGAGVCIIIFMLGVYMLKKKTTAV